MFILKGFKLFRMNISASVDSGGVPEGRHTSAAAGRGETWWASIFVGRAATAGGLRSGRLNEIIITYLGNLSIATSKWFRCFGIADWRRGKDPPLQNPQGWATHGRFRNVRPAARHPQEEENKGMELTVCVR